MRSRTSIEWTETTWNPVLGCAKVSPGCTRCYAERLSGRLAAMGRAIESRGGRPGRLAAYASVLDEGGGWNGTIHIDERAVDEPLRWSRPRVVFVNSMSDLFHEDVPFSFVERIFETMGRCPQHTFQVLTKRPEIAVALGSRLAWPTNVWMGTSVESARYVARVESLRVIPAHVRFLSVEPLLGPIPALPLAGIHWVIVGGESGPGARAMQPEWAADLRDQCRAAGVAFFFKQWGGVNKKRAGRVLDGRTWDEMPDPTGSKGTHDPQGRPILLR